MFKDYSLKIQIQTIEGLVIFVFFIKDIEKLFSYNFRFEFNV